MASHTGFTPSLTGLRGLAALLVCATHAAFWTGKYTDDFEGWFFARLEIGLSTPLAWALHRVTAPLWRRKTAPVVVVR